MLKRLISGISIIILAANPAYADALAGCRMRVVYEHCQMTMVIAAEKARLAGDTAVGNQIWNKWIGLMGEYNKAPQVAETLKKEVMLQATKTFALSQVSACLGQNKDTSSLVEVARKFCD